ncbi:phage scaffolding protein [Metabacillus sp. HB246100]
MSLQELLGEELYKQVMEKVGDQKIDIVSNGEWIPKTKFNELNENTKELKKQLKDRDTQLSELGEKATGNEELQKTIQQLQADNKQIKEDYENKIKQQTFNFALKDALSGAKAKNPKAVEALLDKESIKFDGEKIEGLEDQLKKLQESDAYLFDVQEVENTDPQFSTGNHQKVDPMGLKGQINQAEQSGDVKKSISLKSQQLLSMLQNNN